MGARRPTPCTIDSMLLRPTDTRLALERLRDASGDAWTTWRRRSLFLAGGVCVGLAAVLMAKAADSAQAVFRSGITVSPLLALLRKKLAEFDALGGDPRLI